VEKDEVEILTAYMPKALSDGEIEVFITEAVSEVDAKGMQDMGKVMAVLKPRLAGRADMAKVSAIVKTKISG